MQNLFLFVIVLIFVWILLYLLIWIFGIERALLSAVAIFGTKLILLEIDNTDNGRHN